ncbi:MAG TPA: ABC transporter substrate-binding protein [Dongiaceae bacterium]|nr:ABC transporter substrate-binding protein [Dongiaceae bacterium]
MRLTSGHSRRHFLASSTGLIGTTVALAMTGSSSLLASLAARADDAPRRGGTLVVAADTEPENLNPAIVASNGVFYMASKVIEPLAEMSEGGKLRRLLAESWTAAPDGTSITFKLRRNVAWHDGKPFTSADVAFSAIAVWKRLQNLGRTIFSNLETVETPDDHTAVFHFSKPTPPQLIENALPAVTSVLPKHLYDGTDIAKNPHNTDLVGTGPFRFVEHKPGEFYRLARNDQYWDQGHPYLDEVVYRVLPDVGAIAAALESGDVQLAAFSAIPLNDLARLQAVPHVKVISKGYDGITYQITLEINHRRKELQDVRVRQALRLAIDSQFIVDKIFLGYAETASGPVPATAKDFYAADLPTPKFDPEQAERLLDEAGYKRGSDGTRFKLDLLPAPWFNETTATGAYVKQALQATGIAVNLVSNDPAAHLKAVYTDHRFDLAIGSPVYRNDPAISTTVLFQSGLPDGVPFTNQYGFANAEIDAVIAEGLTAIDTVKRIAIYRRLQHLVSEQLPLLNLVDFTFLTVARDNVRNVGNNPRWATSSWYDTWLST